MKALASFIALALLGGPLGIVGQAVESRFMHGAPGPGLYSQPETKQGIRDAKRKKDADLAAKRAAARAKSKNAASGSKAKPGSTAKKIAAAKKVAPADGRPAHLSATK